MQRCRSVGYKLLRPGVDLVTPLLVYRSRLRFGSAKADASLSL